jgi:fructan beta-fructosidase
MSNWQYANDVPTSPWRSAMTVPRELSLRTLADGLRIIQKPVKEMEKLRGPVRRFKGGSIDEANAWVKQTGLAWEPLEMTVEFGAAPRGTCGLKLFKNATETTLLTVDREGGRIAIDRTHSGDVGFSPRFPGVSSASLSKPDGRVKLHIYLDACSIEVYVNDGEHILTALVFPSKTARGLEFFGPNEAAVTTAEAWPLASSWKAR